MSRLTRIDLRRKAAFARWLQFRTTRAWQWLLAWDAAYHDCIIHGGWE